MLNDLRIYKYSEENGISKAEYYLKDALNRDVAIYNITNNTWTYHVYGTQLLARINKLNTNTLVALSEPTYYLYDHLGNTRVTYQPTATQSLSELDENGNSISYTGTRNKIIYAGDYFAYGKILREFSEGAVEKYLTTFHERDEETGLDYRGARYYDSDIARFLSTDPWQAKYPSWSTYNYVMGNPIVFIDPTGKGPQDWIKNKKTGEFKWDKNVTSSENTPEGSEYIGKNDNDIINNLFGKSNYEKIEKQSGLMGADEEKGAIGFYNGTIHTKLKISLTANVESKYNKYGELESKTFNGVLVSSSTVSEMFAAIPGGNPNYQLKDASLSLNGKKMNRFYCQGDCVREIRNMPSAYVAFSSKISAAQIQKDFGKSYYMNFKFEGQYADDQGKIFGNWGMFGLLSANRTYINTLIQFNNK
jgi:RHS repeat-associated protein